jgi:ribosomal protein S18 acetylase RimI-like enzyme
MMLRIRTMTADDFPAVRALLEQVSSGTYRWSEAELAEALADPTFHPHVAEQDGMIIAYGELHVLRSPTYGRYGRLENIVVDKNFRLRGIARTLCTFLIALGRTYQIGKWELRTTSSAAFGLYISLGFDIATNASVLTMKPTPTN